MYIEDIKQPHFENNLLSGCVVVLLLDFLLLVPIILLLESIGRYYEWWFFTPIYMPLLVLVTLDLVGYGIYILVAKMRG